MNEELYQEAWLMTGNEEEFEKIENFLQEMGFNYRIVSYDVTKNDPAAWS